jgi:hypothetical protein
MPVAKSHTFLGRTVQGKPIFNIPGSLLFNNSNQFLQFPREGVINLTDGASPFTIEAWIKPTSIRNPGLGDYGNIIIGDTESGGNNWSLQLLNNKVSFYSYSTSLGGTFFTSISQIPLNAWTHVAVSYDGGSTLSIFINGILNATFGDYYPPNNQFSVITIGNLFGSGSTPWSNGDYAYEGYITNLRINDDQFFYQYVGPFEPTTPLGYISGTTLLLLANINDPTKDSSPEDVTITNVGSVAFSSQYPTVADCSNNDAKVLMVGWYAGPRALTRQSENLYYYGQETVFRENGQTPWTYANDGTPFVTSLTVAEFPWQAVWPSPYTATKVCPSLGVPVASTASIIIAGSFLDGRYTRVPQGTEIMNSAGTVDGPFVLNGGTYMYRKPDYSYGPNSDPNLNFFAPGSIIRSAGGEGDAVVSTPFPTWTFGPLYFNEAGGPGDAGYWYSWPGESSTNPSTDPNYIPITGWTGHYTNFTIVPGGAYINQITISNGTYVAANSTYIRNEPNGAFTRADGLGSIFWNGSEWYMFSADIGNVAVNYNNLDVHSWEPKEPGNSSNIIAVNT